MNNLDKIKLKDAKILDKIQILMDKVHTENDAIHHGKYHAARRAMQELADDYFKEVAYLNDLQSY